jgi:hypothetical protein
VATKTMKVENTGYITNGWGLDPVNDKEGPVNIQIYVNEKLVHTFDYIVVKKK